MRVMFFSVSDEKIKTTRNQVTTQSNIPVSSFVHPPFLLFSPDILDHRLQDRESNLANENQQKRRS